MLTRRKFSGLVTASLAAPAIISAGAARGATNWPNRYVTVYIPAPPGGTTDIIGRKLAEALQMRLGQPFKIENQGGASGNIAAETVARSPNDGYTLLVGTLANLATNQFLFPNLKFNVQRDLSPVTRVFGVDNILCVTKKFPAKDMKEFIAYAKANPGKITFASSGVGGSLHLFAVMLELRAGIQMRHIPYSGSAPAIIDVVAGNVDVIFDSIPSSGPQVDSSNMRALAVSSANRSARLPNVPTMAESGVANFAGQAWGTMMAPAGTPPEIVDKLSTLTQEIYKQPAILKFFADQGAEATASSPAETGAFLKRESETWGEVIKAGNVKLG